MWRKEERQQSFAEQEVYASMGSNQPLAANTGRLRTGRQIALSILPVRQ